jgi:putative component of toxin-antitoxin plasmid stabilization module
VAGWEGKGRLALTVGIEHRSCAMIAFLRYLTVWPTSNSTTRSSSGCRASTTWNRTVVAIDRIAALGSSARMPFSRALGDGLFELRFSLGPTARRITYRFTTDNRIILLTTFRKQRNNERAEIARARKIAEECARLNP